jgi:DNA-binding transcriptional MocR family regulator
VNILDRLAVILLLLHHINPIASKIVELCKEAGVLLTPAGATHPYGNDPKNNTLRIAPTFINEKELEIALDVFVTATKIAHSQA